MMSRRLCTGPKVEGRSLSLGGRALTLELSSRSSPVGCSDGSMPNSPVSDCGPGELDEEHCQSLEKDTQQIIHDFLKLYTGLSRSYGQHQEVVQALRTVVDRLLVKHELVYKGMLTKLKMEDRRDDMGVIRIVVKDVFSDGITNWGRITSVLAFGAVVSQHLNESGQGHCVRLVGQEISSYLLSEKKDWLLKNNGWDGFLEFFQVPDPESKMWNALMTFATVAGVGAGIAFLMR